MSANHLEQLIAEWYEIRGFFVRRNVNVGKREKGGYECELDIVAFHPEERKLVHIEPSLDAHTWEVREKRFRKKFLAGRKYIPLLFRGVELPDEIEQIAVLLFASKKHHETISGGKLMLVPEILKMIAADLEGRRLDRSAVSEQFPLLRTIQYVAQYRKEIWEW